jgi:predicted nucleotidyltransferase
MQAKDIELHLIQLGQELSDRGVEKPIRVLMIGGAYMLLLTKMQRSTDDVDILWLDEEDALQRAIDALREGVQAVAEKQHLEPDWFNYMTHLLMYDVVTIPKGTLWKRLGPLHIYVPPKEYILALKILAGRKKDIEDSNVLLRYVKIKTRQQARRLLDRYVSPAAQATNAEEIEQALQELFQEE